jgi:hypothetical protein
VKESGLRYRPILTAPCRNGCPAHIDIPYYIGMIEAGLYDASLARILIKRRWPGFSAGSVSIPARKTVGGSRSTMLFRSGC